MAKRERSDLDKYKAAIENARRAVARAAIAAEAAGLRTTESDLWVFAAYLRTMKEEAEAPYRLQSTAPC